MRIIVNAIIIFFLFSNYSYSRVSFGKDVVVSPNDFFLANEFGVDSSIVLPPPPSHSSLRFENDKLQYEIGLSLRKTERGMMASRDCDLTSIWKAFSEAFGCEISKENTPEIYILMKRASGDLGGISTRVAKNKYKRPRPYVFLNEPTCNSVDEQRYRENGSYPSGHSSIGWGLALILSEINPGRQEFILKRGYEFGQSRVICGYHWQSDVDAGRMTGAAGVAALHANEEFNKQLQKAKLEFSRLLSEGRVKTDMPELSMPR